jgi:hypothetical protein
MSEPTNRFMTRGDQQALATQPAPPALPSEPHAVEHPPASPSALFVPRTGPGSLGSPTGLGSRPFGG